MGVKDKRKQKQKEKAEKAARQQAADRFLNNTLYDENGYAKTLTQNDLARAAKRAREICGKDPDLYGDLLRKLNSAAEKKNAWKETEAYKYGDNLIAQFKASGLELTPDVWERLAADRRQALEDDLAWIHP